MTRVSIHNNSVSVHGANPLMLRLELSLKCILINRLLTTYSSQELSKEKVTYLLGQVQQAAQIAGELMHWYDNKLNDPRHTALFHKQQNLLDNLSQEMQQKEPKAQQPLDSGYEIDCIIDGWTGDTNPYRILVNRLRRFVNLLDVVYAQTPCFHYWVNQVEGYLNPIMTQISWSFHAPRLIKNLFLILKHSVTGPWMSPEEQDLGWQQRFLLQIQHHWFELGNDVIWVLIGTLNCLVYVGALTPHALYANCFGFLFDVVNVAIRGQIELKRLDKLRQYYDERNDEPMLVIIDERIAHERHRTILNLLNTAIVLGGMTAALPVFALSAQTVLLTAIGLLILWGVHFKLSRNLMKQRPTEQFVPPEQPLIERLRFFVPKADVKAGTAPFASNPPVVF